VLRVKGSSVRIDTGRLIPLESYILSRIESPTSVSDVGALSGLGEEDAHRAVCALVAAGFLKLLDNDKDEDEDPAAREAEETLERVREDVIRRLHFSSSADYYEILGVTRHGTTAEIKTAYYHLAKKYHPDRYHQADSGDLRAKLEALFAVITQAYDTLSQPGQRASYDDKIRKASGSLPHSPPAATMPLSVPEPIASAPRVSEEERVPTGDLKASNGQPGDIDPSQRPQPESSGGDLIPGSNAGGPQLAPAQRAEHYYQQGRARFERKEYHAAVHLLREAIKLDPSRAP